MGRRSVAESAVISCMGLDASLDETHYGHWDAHLPILLCNFSDCSMRFACFVRELPNVQCFFMTAPSDSSL